MKAKSKPAAKKAAPKKPAGKSLLKTAGKLAGKALSALSKADKERMKREAAKAKEAEKKALAKAKADAAKEKEREKREALKAKADAARAKEAEKKAAAKAKADAIKAKEAEKKAAIKAKADALKEKERAKKDGDKAKILAAKEAEKAKKIADKEAAKAAKIQAKVDEKARKKAEKELAKRRARGEDVDDEEGGAAPRARGGDEDDDEEDFKRVASKGKKGSRFDEGEGRLSRYGNANDLEGKLADEIAELREHFAWPDIVGAIASMEFFIDPKDDSCVEKGCDNIRSTLSWCRLHYLKNWKGLQRKKEVLAEGKLQEYIEEMISKYPAKYVDAIMKDLGDDKDFYKVLNELNISNEFDFDEEDFEADSDSDSDDDIGIEQTFTGSMRYEDTE